MFRQMLCAVTFYGLFLPAVYAQQVDLDQLAKAMDQANLDPDVVPANCQSPMALQQMMMGIQQTVGDRMGDQLVDLRNPRTVSIGQGTYTCRVITVWGNHPAVEGTFRRYKNAVGRLVYAWNGEREMKITP